MKTITRKPAESELWAAYTSSRSIEDRNTLAVHYENLVEVIADKVHMRLPPEVQKDDLVQWGQEGLLQAIAKFDPSRKIKFASFGTLRIRGNIIDRLREFSPQSRKVNTLIQRLDRAEEALRNKLNREPTPEEVAAQMGFSMECCSAAMMERRAADIRSIRSRYSNKESDLIDDMTDESSPDPFVVASTTELIGKMIAFVLESYGVTEALILRLYYFDHLRLWEIGDMIGKSESRTSQVHEQLLRALEAKFTIAA